MTIIQAIILGTVQGLTEFLPISSSAHLNLFPWLLKWQEMPESFDVALHIGTLLAIIVYFFKDWIRLIAGGYKQVVKKEKTTNKSYTVTELIPITKYSNIKAIAYINNIEKESNLEEITTKNDLIEYSWEEIAEIAKAISNDTSITDDTETATVTVNGVQKTLNVGDRTKLDGKTVRILGFNHNELVEPTTAYGSSTATGKAGISFEYLDY